MDTPRATRTFRFQPGLGLWLFTAVFLPLFISLGCWQLNRADEKAQLLRQTEQRIAFGDIDWSAPPLLQHTEVSGRLLPEPTFFLDNKTHDGRPGYEIWRLLKTPAGNLVVSLGWVSGSQDRRLLPALAIADTLTEQAVQLRPPPSNALLGVDANLRHAQGTDNWVVQALAADWVANVSGQPVLAFAQLLDATQTGLGINIWQPTVMSPQRHRGYAVQWFGMALALLGMFLYAGFKSDKNKNRGTERE